jgi:hypothetical protein
MMSTLDQRLRILFDLSLARQRMADCARFSPSWDAAIAQVEDLERRASLLGNVAPLIASIDIDPRLPH